MFLVKFWATLGEAIWRFLTRASGRPVCHGRRWCCKTRPTHVRFPPKNRLKSSQRLPVAHFGARSIKPCAADESAESGAEGFVESVSRAKRLWPRETKIVWQNLLLRDRAARFFLVELYQNGKNISNGQKISPIAANNSRWPQNKLVF
jgi:hypothetical protein